MNRRLLLALVVAATLVAGGTAQAGYLTGTFTIDIGRTSAAVAGKDDATFNNPLLSSPYLLETITYNGDLNFFTPPGNTIGEFLASGGGSSNVSAGTAGLVISTGNFVTTTVFRISGTTGAINGSIRHDDGMGLYRPNGSTIAASITPTVAIDTPYSFEGGAFQLVYVAANDNPEVLQFNVVPDGGATLMLLGGALVGLGALRRKFRG